MGPYKHNKYMICAIPSVFDRIKIIVSGIECLTYLSQPFMEPLNTCLSLIYINLFFLFCAFWIKIVLSEKKIVLSENCAFWKKNKMNKIQVRKTIILLCDVVTDWDKFSFPHELCCPYTFQTITINNLQCQYKITRVLMELWHAPVISVVWFKVVIKLILTFR